MACYEAVTRPYGANVLCNSQSYACHMDDKWPYPLIADPNRELAVQLGMIDPVAKDRSGIPQTCRAVSNAIYIYVHEHKCILVHERITRGLSIKYVSIELYIGVHYRP